MKKKKIIFSILTILILLTSSIGLTLCYDTVLIPTKEKIDFNKNKILYDIFDNIYPLSFQLDNVNRTEILPEYITANQKASDAFYDYSIKYNGEIMANKKNIKYYAESIKSFEGNTISLSNTSDNLVRINNSSLKNKYQWYLNIIFDADGDFFINPLGNKEIMNKNYEAIWNNYKQTQFEYLDYHDPNAVLHNPKNISIYFAIPTKLSSNSADVISSYAYLNTNAFRIENIIPFVAIAVAICCIYTLIYPYEIEKEVALFNQLGKIKLEILLLAITGVFAGMSVIIYGVINDTLNGYYLARLSDFGLKNYCDLLINGLNIICWLIVLFLCVFSCYYLKSIFKKGFINTLKNHTVGSWLFKTSKKIITQASNFDLKDNTNKIVIKIVLINGLIVSILCCFFTLGIILTIIYSGVLFIVLKNKLNEFKHDYHLLLNAVRRLSNGDFEVEIHENIGIFNALGTEFTNIKNGFEKAVNEEVKSQKMKTELISNVSHDLKTPLTSIITYVDLLKDNSLDENKRTEYLNTLDRNALRLKNLIADLFEVSKVNSGDVKLDIIDVDIVALIQQAKFELTDKFEAKNLIFKTNYPEEKIILSLDSLKTYRIFENLLINISKYALDYTRVYIDVINYDEYVEIIFKNISAEEIKISEDELVERFVQGDISRNTSGSGLGLAIAKSFTELQKGTFKISVDGDLFKAVVTFKKKTSE